MTKEERENALHCLKVMIDEEVCEECNLYGTTGTDHCESDCVRVAIKALDQEPCSDVISRQAVLDIIRFEDKWLLDAKGHNADTEIAFGGMNAKIADLPSVNPQEPKEGHWIIHDNHRECSNCKVWLPKDMPRNSYCPNCGAKMESEEV